MNAADQTDLAKPSEGPASSTEKKTSSGGTRCPHCHAIADVEPSPEARFVCSVCGGVRIPIEDPKVERSAEGLDWLKRATAARSAKTVWGLLAIVVAAFGAFSALVLWVTLSFAHPAPIAVFMAAFAVAVPFAFALFAWRRSRVCGVDFAPALDKAWMEAAADIARSRGGELDRAEFAKATRISETDADKLLARMSAASLLASSVTTGGSLKYTLVETGAAERAKSLPAAR